MNPHRAQPERVRRRGVAAGALAALALLPSARGQQEAKSGGQTQEQGQKRKVYDPDANMAPDGTTVLKPDLPDDLKNPDRWRYTPEGRIKPGNTFERFLATTFITPIFFREQDIGFGGGVAITDIDFRNQRFQEFANIVGSYTEEGQQAFRFNWARWIHHREIPAGGIIRDERSRYGLGVGYTRTLTRRFFGLEGSLDPRFRQPAFGGVGKSGEETESSYTEELFTLSTGVTVSVPEAGDDLLLALGARFENHQLEGGRVTGVPDTNAPVMGVASDELAGLPGFAEIFDRGEDVAQLWLSGSLAYDTRDSISNPYDGVRVGVGVSAAPAQTGLAPGMVVSADIGGAMTVPPLFHDGGRPDEQNPPTDVVAFSAFVSDTYGDLPFYSLPSLGGGDTLRGYINNRFTGRAAAHGSLEYRFAIVPRGVRFTKTIRLERVSLAAFYDFGWVSNSVGKLGNRYLDSVGAGLRLGLAREAIFRVDVGFDTEGESNLTVSFGNPF